MKLKSNHVEAWSGLQKLLFHYEMINQDRLYMGMSWNCNQVGLIESDAGNLSALLSSDKIGAGIIKQGQKSTCCFVNNAFQVNRSSI